MAASWFIARHGETIFNAAARMQGGAPHTPLTRSGFAQAEAMGDVLRQRLGTRPAVELWASPTGRALQTLSVICEHLELDWHAAKTDPRLAEMDVGEWGGLYYRDIIAQAGEFVDREAMLFSRRPPGGEWYDEIAERLRSWLAEQAPFGDRLLVMHDMSSRVLRGLLTALDQRPECGAPVADRLPQGSVVEIVGGTEIRLGPAAAGSS